MFMKTIAVGPFLLVESWVTGGTTVAIDFVCRHGVASLVVKLDIWPGVARRERRATGVRRLMMMNGIKIKGTLCWR